MHQSYGRYRAHACRVLRRIAQPDLIGLSSIIAAPTMQELKPKRNSPIKDQRLGSDALGSLPLPFPIYP